MRVIVTGLTRDGLYRIDDGRILHPVRNLRFNESLIEMLRNVEAMSAPERALWAVVPALRARDFVFTSGTRGI